MAKDTANARAYSDGGVFVAPLGSTAPTTPTGTYDAAYEEVGWLSDNGITESRTQDTKKKNAWQGGALIRVIKSTDSRSFKFQCLEENAVVMGLVRPGATVTTATGVTTSVVHAYTAQDLRQWGIDLVDGSVHKRIVIGNGEVTDVSDIVYKTDDLTVYEVTVTCYPDTNNVLYTEYSDAAGVAVA